MALSQGGAITFATNSAAAAGGAGTAQLSNGSGGFVAGTVPMTVDTTTGNATVGGTLNVTGYSQSNGGTYHSGNSFAGTRLGATTDFAFSATEGGWDIAGIFTAYTLGGTSQIAVLNKNITGGAGDLFKWRFSEYHVTHDVMTLTWDGTVGNLAVMGALALTGKLNAPGLPSGTLAAPPAGLNIGDLWLDTTTGAQYPMVRMRAS